MTKDKNIIEDPHDIFVLMLEDIKIPFNRAGEKLKGPNLYLKDSIQTHEAGELYFLNCFRHTSRLIAIPKRLELSLSLMKSKPNKSLLIKNGIHRTEYIEHHFSNFLFTIVSAKDISYVVVNTILNLGMDEKQVNNQTIMNNNWVKNLNIKPILQKMEKLISKYGLERNLLAHQGETPKLSTLDIIGLFDSTNHLMSKIGKKPHFDIKLVHKLIDEAIAEEIYEFNKEINAIKEINRELLDRLLPVYKYWKAQPDNLRSPKCTFKYSRK